MSTEESLWSQTPPVKPISSNEVHVWRVLPRLTADQIEYLREILSIDELTRAGRFHFEREQRGFIAARGILRKILGHYLDKNPRQIHFEYTHHGKPILTARPGYHAICFNLSHSDGSIIFAISPDQNIGIDIERIRDDVDMDQISQRFFSNGEISSLKRIPKENWPELFFQYWTRKEAFLKAMGEGISFPSEQCDVSLVNGKIFSPIILQGNHKVNSSWYVKDLFPRHGYAAALAVEKADSDVSYWHYLP
ncbi:MAG TPA: 4'-phosphopantetheinyl transferase superfamily protein [Chitinophagaceae bacterium]|nr:4'-phosphopantetheinyl transferase superfamily protein [Chitinophagaceae bacterium]